MEQELPTRARAELARERLPELWFCMQTGNFVLFLVGHELEESSRDGFTQARVVSDAFSLDLDDSSHEIDVAAGEVHLLVLDELRGAEVYET